uniref:Uncharacterized protein n=1 Tax=Mola mola TaxID=94237 RepID=A0A3Q3VTV3_MOLML
MVRDDCDTVVQSQTPNCAAGTKSHTQPTEEAAGPERAKSAERVNPESQEPQLDPLHCSQLSLEEEPELWQLVNGANAQNLPTHLRPFSSAAEYKLVKYTYVQLLHSGYYWGSMAMEEAHKILTHTPLGTFLIRDSGQPDVFFTLSYQSDEGPTSVRIQLNNLHFSLYGSNRTFASFFTLLTYYTSSSCKLTVPYRRQRPESLQQMCRRAVIRTYGAESISTSPGLSVRAKNYVHAYPHCI